MASSVTAAPCLVVSSHRILRNCGWGFIGSRQPRRAADLTGRFRVIVPTGAAGLRRSLQVGDQELHDDSLPSCPAPLAVASGRIVSA